jgi:HSP20 family molecular chaperone IbpA
MATSKPAPAAAFSQSAPRIVGEGDRQAFDQAIHSRVSERAYQLFEASGGEHGNAHSHWLQAQNEILQRGLEVRESGSWLSINAALPDVDGDDIEICLDANHVIVRLKKSESAETTESKTFSHQETFLIEDLRTDIDPATASAAFKDQKLTLMVKKRYPETGTSTQQPPARSEY